MRYRPDAAATSHPCERPDRLTPREYEPVVGRHVTFREER
ncbi:50S ribosomal protein L33 [Streptomyces sp. GS7]|nr:50S ribosomal protein L33 [Streptomyces sp. GS7]